MKLPLDRIARSDLPTGGWIALLASLVFACFHFFGVTDVGYDARIATQSAFVWIWRRWESEMALSPFAHGAWIPLLVLAMLWSRRRELRAAAGPSSRIGLVVLIIALLLHGLGARAQQTRLSLGALILVLWSIPVLWRGHRLGLLLAMPCGLLFLSIPLNFLEGALAPLRYLSVHASDLLMSGLGLPVQVVGSRLLIGADRKAVLDLADPACGLHAFLAVTLIAILAGYFLRLPVARRAALVAWVPVAFVLGQVTRCVMFGIPAMTLPDAQVTAAFARWSGWVMLAASILMLVLLPLLIRPEHWRRRFRQLFTVRMESETP